MILSINYLININFKYLFIISIMNQNSKVDGSGEGTFKLFSKRNSAKVSTGSDGNFVKI